MNSSYKTIIEFVVEHLDQCPADRQIKVYQALADIVPDPTARAHANKIAERLSGVSAMQLEFADYLRQSDQPGHDGDGDGHHKGKGGKK